MWPITGDGATLHFIVWWRAGVFKTLYTGLYTNFGPAPAKGGEFLFELPVLFLFNFWVEFCYLLCAQDLDVSVQFNQVCFWVK